MKTLKRPSRLLIFVLAIGLAVLNFSGFQDNRGLVKAASTYSCPSLSQPLLFRTDLNKTKVDSEKLEKTHRDLQQSLLQLRGVSNSSKNDLVIKAQGQAMERKAHLLEVMRENPEAALASILLDQQRTDLSSFSANCIETPVSIDGTLKIIHIDFSDGGSEDHYSLITSSGEELQLHPARDLRQKIISGIKVRINGYRLDNEVLFDANEQANGFTVLPAAGVSQIGAAGIPDAQGVQNTAMLLTNFSNTTINNITKAQWDDIMFNQTNNYYIKTSYNQTSITGKSFGWFNLPITQTCNSAAILSASVAAADPSVDFSSYGRLVIVVPFPSSCTYSGLGTIGRMVVPTQDGNINMSVAWISAQAPSPGLFEHEFGHNLGVHHASFLYCGSVTAAQTGCTIDEYGDWYDVMGAFTYQGQMNAPHRDYLGWFGASNIATVTTDGTSTIGVLETSTPNLQALKIQRATNDYLYIEYRQPIDTDQNFSYITGTNVFLGGLLHSLQFNYKPLLLDVTPPASALAPALEVGNSFTDPATGARITALSRTSSGLTLDVRLGKTDFTAPTVVIASPVAGSAVSGTIAVSVSVSSGYAIGKVEYYLNGATTPFATATAPPFSVSWDTTLSPNGANWLLAKAYDTSGAAWGAWGNVGTSPQTPVNVSNSDPIPDLIPPTVSITSPADGATFSTSTVTVSANAQDNKGIARVEFWKDTDSSPFYGLFSAPYTFPAAYSPGTHTIKAKAFDLSLNSAESSPVRFTISLSPDQTPPTITWKNPADGSFVKGKIALRANATDNVGVIKVEFYVDGSLFATDTTSSYSVNWDTTPLPSGSTHLLFARAYDAAGNIRESQHATVKVDNISPTVSFTNPTNGAKITAGRSITLSASASDDVGVTKARFLVNGSLICTDTSPPYDCAWTAPSGTGIKYSLRARAFDAAGNIGSQTISVTSQ